MHLIPCKNIDHLSWNWFQNNFPQLLGGKLRLLEAADRTSFHRIRDSS